MMCCGQLQRLQLLPRQFQRRSLKSPMTSTWIDNPLDEPSPMFDALPIYSLSKTVPHRTDDASLTRYYENHSLMLRNIIVVGTATIGWNVALQIVNPLIAVRLLDLGVHENIQGTISSINLWAVSFLVMLFGWMSDHTISRYGRRKPYLFIAAPFIITAISVFPFFATKSHIPLLLTLQVVYLLFMDLKNSTFTLVMIDVVPGPKLARAMAVVSVSTGLVNVFANRYAAALLSYGDKAPMLLAAGVMLMTTITAAFVREPPVIHPRTGPFRLWSTFHIAAAYDKRLFVLMAGIALLFAFPSVCTQWLWFWSKETLGLTRQSTFQAISWAGAGECRAVLSDRMDQRSLRRDENRAGLSGALHALLRGHAPYTFQGRTHPARHPAERDFSDVLVGRHSRFQIESPAEHRGNFIDQFLFAKRLSRLPELAHGLDDFLV